MLGRAHIQSVGATSARPSMSRRNRLQLRGGISAVHHARARSNNISLLLRTLRALARTPPQIFCSAPIQFVGATSARRSMSCQKIATSSEAESALYTTHELAQ